MKNYYAILEVPRNTSREEIKKSYLEHICFIHPDRFEKGSPDWANATNLLLDINEAYLCLSDPERRREYDAMLEKEDSASRARAEATSSARLIFALLVTAAVLLLFYYNQNSSRGDFHEGNPGETAHGSSVPIASAGEKNQGTKIGGSSKAPEPPHITKSPALLDVSRERPSNTATQSNSCQYIQLGSDEFYETLLEVDSSVVYGGGDIAAIWTKHIQHEGQENIRAPQKIGGTNVNAGNIGWSVMLNAYDLVNDTVSLLKIIYYDKFGGVIGEYNVPNERIQTTQIAPVGASRDMLNWVKSAAERTNGLTDQHDRAQQMGRLISLARDKMLNTAYFRANGKIENYEVKKGGTISAEFCFCRKLPVQGASVVRSKLIKGTPVFVTKRYKNEKGNVWFYIEHIQAKGWVASQNLKVY